MEKTFKALDAVLSGSNTGGTRDPEIVEREVKRLQAWIDAVRDAGGMMDEGQKDSKGRTCKVPAACRPGFHLTEQGKRYDEKGYA